MLGLLERVVGRLPQIDVGDQRLGRPFADLAGGRDRTDRARCSSKSSSPAGAVTAPDAAPIRRSHIGSTLARSALLSSFTT